jgi:hypothetical protein
MKWWLPILIVLGAVAAALAQDMTNGLNNKGTQLMKNGLNNSSGSIVGGGGGGGGNCTGTIDASKGCPLPMLGM